MNLKEIFNLFLLLSAIHGFVFSAILLYSKNGREKSMFYLNLLILSISFHNFQIWGIEKKIFQNEIGMNMMYLPIHFLIVPFLYAFTINYLKFKNKSDRIIKFVIAIFILLSVAQLGFVYSFKNTFPENYNHIFEIYTSIEEVISLIVAIVLFGYSYVTVYKKEYNFPDIKTYDNLNWLRFFFKIATLGLAFWISAFCIKLVMNFKGFIFSYYPLRIFMTLIIYWLGYEAISRINILKERKTLRKKIKTIPVNNILEDLNISPTIITETTIIKNSINSATNQESSLEYEKEEVTTASLEAEKLTKYQNQFEIIDSFIRKNNKFLEPKYTLQNLAFDTELSTSTLSYIINNVYGKTFIDYINEMKISQAKLLLLNPEYEDYTITSIGLESGFNSKSTFYTVFKKHTGLTPNEYKNKELTLV